MADTRRYLLTATMFVSLAGPCLTGCKTPWQQSNSLTDGGFASFADKDTDSIDPGSSTPGSRMRSAPRSKQRPGTTNNVVSKSKIPISKQDKAKLRNADRADVDSFLTTDRASNLPDRPEDREPRQPAEPNAGAVEKVRRQMTAQREAVSDMVVRSASQTASAKRAGQDAAVVSAAGEEQIESRESDVQEGGVRIHFSDETPPQTRQDSHTAAEAKIDASDTEEVLDPSQSSAVEKPEARQPNVEAVSYPVPSAATQAKAVTAAVALEDHDVQSLAAAILDKLDEDSATATDKPDNSDLAAQKQLVRMILADLASAQDPLEDLEPETQHYVRDTLQAIYKATAAEDDPTASPRLTQALEHHREAIQKLASQANLKIRNVSFCTEVDSFGVVKRFPRYQFRAGQQVILYCELENFVSQVVQAGFETKLRGQYEIVDSQGQRVASHKLPEDKDTCANRRSDFYIAYLLYLPTEIDTGSYQLRLVIEDIHGRKSGEARLDFQVR